MEFASPERGKPPVDFRANNSYRNKMCRWDFFMLNLRTIGVGGAIEGIARYRRFTIVSPSSKPRKALEMHLPHEENAIGVERAKS
jgi:hypothetical protein